MWGKGAQCTSISCFYDHSTRSSHIQAFSLKLQFVDVSGCNNTELRLPMAKRGWMEGLGSIVCRKEPF